MRFIRFNEIHEAVHVAGAVGLIDWIARVFPREAIDVIARAMRLVSDFDNVPHDFQPMSGTLWINDKHGNFAVHGHIARFAGCRWTVDAHVRPVIIAPDGNGMRLPIGIYRAQGAQNRALE